MLPNTLYEARIPLIPKPEKDITKRGPSYLIKIYTKILNKLCKTNSTIS
jgi:hypothetical protein